jgi:hypothetical protein
LKTLLFNINRESVVIMRAFHQARMRDFPRLRPQVERLQAALAPITDPLAALQACAPLHTELTGNSTMFVRYDSADLTHAIESRSGVFQEPPADFIADSPTANLMAKTLTVRQSVHVPSFANLDKRSIEQVIADTGGKEVYSSRTYQVELVAENDVTVDTYYNKFIQNIIPYNLKPAEGAVLLTPLGLERSTEFGFGFIYEYRPQPFSYRQIMEARALSTAFTLAITERIMAELGL